jgi:sec-independent protein translocase protein TatA
MRLGPTELLLILAIVLVLFGGRKIPEIARGLGEGIRNFKDAMSSEKQVDKPTDAKK